MVEVLAALHGQDDDGLLAIDWKKITGATRQLTSLGSPIGPFLPWIEKLARWARIVEREASTGGGDSRLDALTVRAGEPDIRELLLYAISSYVERMQRLSKTAIIEALTSIPESIMQALAAAYCGIDFRSAPGSFPQLEYKPFFWGPQEFRIPAAGSKMELTSLFVVVPTMLMYEFECKLAGQCEPSSLRLLHQKYVDLTEIQAHTVKCILKVLIDRNLLSPFAGNGLV